MTISGSGTGTPGGTQVPSLLSDQSAAASVLRAGMGIIKNLDTISFTDVDKKALWKYDTSSSKPTLHPLEHVRSDVSPSRIDDGWRQILKDLINGLEPEDVRNAYKQNLSLKPELRNASLDALERLLEGVAKALNWLQNSVIALDPQNPAAGPGSEIEARRIFNATLVQRVMQGIMGEGQTTFQSMNNELLKIGRNNPQFDDLVGILNQIGGAYTTLLNLNNETG